MNKPREISFEQSVLASRLLSRDQLDQALAALRASRDDPDPPTAEPTAEQLAGKLVEMGWLNAWQADQLLEGRAKFNLGPYWIVDSIGQGGMGQVFKAQHEILGRQVAVKVLPRDKSTPEAIAAFNREIRAQARLDHENLVRAFDAGSDGNVHYLVTEYVPGADLRKLVRRNGLLSMEQAASIISQVAAGLKHAHERGLIHRDVKPGNVLVTPDGRAKLSDLGLASSPAGEADAERDPQVGKIVGTADYLSPEHVTNPSEPAPAWDIYSLGCTLYYAMTGKVPFPSGSAAEKARAHCELQPLDPRWLNPQLDVPFVDLMADMMAKDPSERISSAAEVIARLTPWTGAPRPVPAGDPQPQKRVQPAEAPPESTAASEEARSRIPEIPRPAPGRKQGSGDSSQTTVPLTSDAEDTASTVELDTKPDQPPAVLLPFLVLVAFPVSLVGAVILAWWLWKLVQ